MKQFFNNLVGEDRHGESDSVLVSISFSEPDRACTSFDAFNEADPRVGRHGKK
jgi:hypothetical protein